MQQIQRFLATTTSKRQRSNETNPQIPNILQQFKNLKPWNKRLLIVATATSALIVASYETRKYRQEVIQSLPNASSSTSLIQDRNLHELKTTIERAGLMGTVSSTKHELEYIRTWHRQHGFQGGLTIRELTIPLYSSSDKHEYEILSTEVLEQRECYYYYYEIQKNGSIQEQIFCRGTTVKQDMITSLKAMLVYDEELECHLLLGYRNHAESLLNDIEPLLLSKKHDDRGHIELCGHSLGGAVALIAACKLRKRGYNVTKVTTIASPRICSRRDVPILSKYLPNDTLRLEVDSDLVPFLPFYAGTVGNLVLFGDSFRPKYISRYEQSTMVQKIWLHLQFLEIIQAMPHSHFIKCYLDHLDELIKETDYVQKQNN